MCKILIVEDEASIREIIENYTTEIGFKYKGVSNAVEALFAIEKYKSIRICMIDLHLPGMDGMSLCRKIKSIDPMMIMIAVTGYKTLFSMVECRQAGFDDMVVKPFQFDLMKELLIFYDKKLNRWGNNV
jgi:DNA-binding response OmpR family regulator